MNTEHNLRAQMASLEHLKALMAEMDRLESADMHSKKASVLVRALLALIYSPERLDEMPTSFKLEVLQYAAFGHGVAMSLKSKRFDLVATTKEAP